MKVIFGAVLCTAAAIGQISTASAEYIMGHPVATIIMYYGSPAGIMAHPLAS
jgi:hypothetical protein